MLDLVTAHRSSDLLRELGRRIAAHRSTAGPFAPCDVVVPHGLSAPWLEVEIARTHGHAVQMRFRGIEAFCAAAVDQEIAVADRGALQSALIAVLDDAAKSERVESSLAAVSRYLEDDDPAAVELRRFGLAARLSRLFEEYALWRPDIVDALRAAAGRGGDDELHVQADLLARSLAHLASLDGRHWHLLPDAVAASQTRGRDDAPPVHVFAPSPIAPGLVRALACIGRSRDVTIYAATPWSSAPSERRLDQLCAAWCRPFAESVGRLEATGAPAHVIAVPGEPPEIEILEPATALDRTRREVAAVAARIWELVAASKGSPRPLRFHEIAVVVPEPTATQHATRLAVELAHHHEIPWTSHLASDQQSSCADAVDQILQLPGSRFDRSRMLSLLSHPAFAERRGPDADPEEWLRFCDRCAVILGADQRDLEDTYLDADSITWDQGLRRLALGAFMADAGDETTILYADRLQPETILSPAIASAGRLARLVRALVREARDLATPGTVRPMHEWSTEISRFVRRWLAPPEGEEELFDGCVEAIADLAESDVTRHPVGWVTAAAWARQAIDSAGGATRGRPFCGVSVGTLAALRPVTFRVVFVIGLQEGAFPRSDDWGPLDLRRSRPSPSDLGHAAFDTALFGELIRNTRERVILGYLPEDPETGDPREASLLVRELQSVAPRDGEHETVSPAPAAPSIPPPPRERAAAQVLELRRSITEEPAERVSLHATLAALAPTERRALERLFAIDDLPPLSDHGAGGIVEVSSSQLRAFLECPFSGWLRRLGIGSDEDDDRLEVSDEPLSIDYLHRARFIESLLTSHASVEEEAERFRRSAIRRGAWPLGSFGARMAEAYSRHVARWRDDLRTRGLPPPRRVLIGHGPPDAPAESVTSAVRLRATAPDGRPIEVMLGGELHPLSDTTSIVGRASGFNGKGDRTFAQLYCDQLLLTAAGVISSDEPREAIVYLCRDSRFVKSIPLAAIDREAALQRLTAIVEDLLFLPHAYQLPFTAIQSHLQDTAELDTEAVRANVLRAVCRVCQYTGFARTDRLPILDDAALVRVIERRFGSYCCGNAS